MRKFQCKVFVLVMFVTAACNQISVKSPKIDIQDAHSGGSIMTFEQKNRFLVSAGWEGRVKIWSLPEGKLVHHWQAHTDSVNGVEYISNSTQILTAGFDARLKLWSNKGKLLKQKQLSSPVTDMLVDESAGLIMTGHDDGSVQWHSMASLNLVSSNRVHTQSVRAIAWHSGKQLLASSSHDGTILIWQKNYQATSLPQPPTDAWTLDFSPDGKFLMGGGWFNLFHWSLHDHKLSVLATPHRGIIKSLQYTKNGSEVATISRQTDSSVYYLNAKTGNITREFGVHELCGETVRLSSGDVYMATSSDDANLRVWELSEAR